jgi:hypothetical protein
MTDVFGREKHDYELYSLYTRVHGALKCISRLLCSGIAVLAVQ